MGSIDAQLGNVGYIDNPIQAEYQGQPLITFSYDDGLKNNYSLALPIHEKWGIPATFNIITSKIGEDNFSDFMTKDNIRDSYLRGIEIASHGHTHEYTRRFTELTEAEIRTECQTSTDILEDATGGAWIQTMAIPYSAYDERVQVIVSEYYRGVRVYGESSNSKPPANQFDLKAVKAMDIHTTFEEIKTIIDQTIIDNKWSIIMMHSIDNGLGVGIQDDYVVRIQLLDRIFEYIYSLGRDVILPINTTDALKFTFGWEW